MSKVAVIGSGSWGSALALVLHQNQHEVWMYMRRREQVEELTKKHTNEKYLPGIVFPQEIEYTDDLEGCVRQADIVILAVTTQSTREYLNKIKKYLNPDTIVVNVSKGIETQSNSRISQIYDEVIGNKNFSVLSGPSHAEEVSVKMPTVIVSSSKNIEVAKVIQSVFSNDYFRVYTNTDIVGVELGGALKNIIALGSGVCDALGYGDNTRAGIITRGIHEISRLGVALGAKPETFSGLSGIGDLIVTCTSKHSRNKRAGEYIAKRLSVEEIQEKVGMVVEGISTTKAAYELAKKHSINMPITEAIYGVIYSSKDIKNSIKELMNRDKKSEMMTEDLFMKF